MFCFWSILLTEILPRILSRVLGWAKAHHLDRVEFEVHSMTLWAFVRTWEKDTFRRVTVAVSDRFLSDATHEMSVLGSVVAAVCSSASLVAVSCESHVLADTYGEYLGSGYNHMLVDYPIFDLRLLKRCLQKVSSSIFRSLDPFWMTEFIVTRSVIFRQKNKQQIPSKNLRKDCCRFLEDLLSIILSTVAAHSLVAQGLSCFCPEIIIRGDDQSTFHVFVQLLDGLFELGWVGGSEIEPAKAEFHWFVPSSIYT